MKKLVSAAIGAGMVLASWNPAWTDFECEHARELTMPALMLAGCDTRGEPLMDRASAIDPILIGYFFEADCGLGDMRFWLIYFPLPSDIKRCLFRKSCCLSQPLRLLPVRL